MNLMIRRVVATVLTITAGIACGHEGKPQYGPWGVDLSGMDRSVRPGDDFFRYSGGTWMKQTQIPSDRSSWSTFSILRANAERDVKAIVDELSKRPNKQGSIEQKVADFYASYLDTTAIERAGLGPVRDDLAAIAAVQSYEDIASLMGRPDISVGGPVSISRWPDAKNPERYAVNIVQSGLSLPDRDYYLKEDAKFIEVRTRYREYVEEMLALVQYPEARKAADTVIALETEIAKRQWSNEKRSDRDLTYNPKTQAELKAFAPDFPWSRTLSALGIPAQDFFVVKEAGAIAELSALFRATPIETWRAYLTFHYLNGMADVLPAAFDDLSFDFNGRTLSGQPQKRERWKRATAALNGALGEAVGQLYVSRHFTPQAKTQMTALVENLRAAYAARISTLAWMSDETKHEFAYPSARVIMTPRQTTAAVPKKG